MQLLFYKNGDCSDKEFERSFKYGFMYVEAFLSPVKLDILTWFELYRIEGGFEIKSAIGKSLVK